MNALQQCQWRHDSAEPDTAPTPWIETPAGLEYLSRGARSLLTGGDTCTVKAADFIIEFSIARQEADQQDGKFALDWALARGGITPSRYYDLAREVAKRMLYEKRDQAEAKLLWLEQ